MFITTKFLKQITSKLYSSLFLTSTTFMSLPLFLFGFLSPWFLLTHWPFISLWITHPSLHPVYTPFSSPSPSLTYSSLCHASSLSPVLHFQILFWWLTVMAPRSPVYHGPWQFCSWSQTLQCCVTQKTWVMRSYYDYRICYIHSLTCALEWCIWAILQAAEGICRFSAQAWEENHQWQCQSSAAASDRPQRSGGICPASSVWRVQCRHWDGCYNTLNK